MNNFTKNLALWGIAGLLMVALFNAFNGAAAPQKPLGSELNLTSFNERAKKGDIHGVKIKDVGKSLEVSGKFDDGARVFSLAPDTDSTFRDVKESAGSYRFTPEPQDTGPGLGGILLSWAPMLLLVGVCVFMMRQMGGGGKTMGFGKSKARLLTEHNGRVTFNNVAGVDEAKEELQEVVEFLRNPQKFATIGAHIPKGVLLVGPPGTGKTLLARSVAGEANVPFFTISGSDFVEMFVGVGASRVRSMFEEAKKHAPCIIFIDEIDAVGRHRGAGLGGGNDEREQTLNQLLVEMDGFAANESVILIAATNRPDVLDPALLRPGRFDRQVTVPNPDVLGRERILQVHMKKVRVGPDVDAKIIARGTPGFSGADLANIVNEAALLAARTGKRFVSHADFEAARDKVMMGAERRSMVMTEDEKRLTAYHEAGHALLACLLPASDPVHKVTIIPRGRALGMVMRLPENDRRSVSREKLNADMVVGCGGRIAEEEVFGHEKVTAGAASDVQHVTKIARHMVTQWALSEGMGFIAYGENQQEVFLGHSVTQTKHVSEATAREIDQAVRKIVNEQYATATNLIQQNRGKLELLAQAMLEYESLTGDEVRQIVATGEKLVRPETAPPAPPPNGDDGDGGAPPPAEGRRGSVPSSGPAP